MNYNSVAFVLSALLPVQACRFCGRHGRYVRIAMYICGRWSLLLVARYAAYI